LATKQITAENIGLKPRPIKMAAGIATAVPKPAIPSSTRIARYLEAHHQYNEQQNWNNGN
jgi:hypothetical protein